MQYCTQLQISHSSVQILHLDALWCPLRFCWPTQGPIHQKENKIISPKVRKHEAGQNFSESIIKAAFFSFFVKLGISIFTLENIENRWFYFHLTYLNWIGREDWWPIWERSIYWNITLDSKHRCPESVQIWILPWQLRQLQHPLELKQ